MRKKLTLAILLLICCFTFAQNGINYKAVIKDGTGAIVANDLIQIKFIILDGATNVYEEVHSPTTDDNGIIIVNIGEGTPIGGGVFSTIDWSSNNHFLNVLVNTGGGLQDLGTTAFKTVPYALLAQDVENTIWNKAGSNIVYNEMDGRVGIGDATPLQTLSILNPSGLENTVRIESQEHPSGKDLLELKIPADAPNTSQFIEMERGTSIVATINGDGAARFKSVQFEDSSIQTTAAIGPIAFGFIQFDGTIASGSNNFSAVWVSANNRYEITIPGESYFYRNYSTLVTPVSSVVHRWRVSSTGGKLLVYFYDATNASVQAEFQFITYK